MIPFFFTGFSLTLEPKERQTFQMPTSSQKQHWSNTHLKKKLNHISKDNLHSIDATAAFFILSIIKQLNELTQHTMHSVRTPPEDKDTKSKRQKQKVLHRIRHIRHSSSTKSLRSRSKYSKGSPIKRNKSNFQFSTTKHTQTHRKSQNSHGGYSLMSRYMADHHRKREQNRNFIG